MLEKIITTHPLIHEEGLFWNDNTPSPLSHGRRDMESPVNEDDGQSEEELRRTVITPPPTARVTEHGEEESDEKKPFITFSQPQQIIYPGGGAVDEEVDLVPPDGGFGWWILFASIVVNILIPGTVKSFGILFVEFMEVFQANAAEASWIPAISFFLYSSTSPFSSALAIRYSDRLVTVVGGLLAAAGLCLSYFATSVSFLCLSYGVIGGLGSGLVYPIGVFMVARYFDKRRGIANGLCTSGSALGSVLMPLLLQYLLSNYGYRKAVFICGCLLLNVCLVALFYDPVEKHLKKVKKVTITSDKKTMTVSGVASTPIPIPSGGRPLFQIGHETPQGESWSPQSNDGPSPIALRLSREDTLTLHRYRIPPPSISSTPDPSSSLPSATLSKLNLSAIPEDVDIDDDGTMDWNYFRGLPLAKQRLIRLSTHGQTPPTSQTSQVMTHHHPSQTFTHFQDERGLCRTLSVASNVSTSSFHYVSTIHHGSLLTAIQYDENVKNIPSTIPNPFCPNCPSRQKNEVTKEQERRKLFDFSLLSSPFFIVFLLSCATTAVSYTNFIIILPAYAQSKGFLKAEASYLLSLVAALDFVGRIGGAALSDLKLVSRNWFFVVGLFCSGLTLTLLPLTSSLVGVSGLCACFGLFSGTYVGVTAVILADRLGPQRLGSSFSISLFLNGILQLGGPPLCGRLFQELKTHEPILIGLGLFLILGSSLWVAVPFFPPEETKESKKINNEENS